MMDSPDSRPATKVPERPPRNISWVYDLALVAVLLAAAFFRFNGLDWDEGTYLHPDERFLAMVESSIHPVGSFREYFATQTSTLNPNNVGHTFFVYGTLPIFFVRYVMEWFGQVGYGEVAAFGRPLAGLFDLLTILVLYLAASRLYGRRVGLLAAAFSAFAVLQIQLSHFFTVDIFLNFFIWAALYCGALIASRREALSASSPPTETDPWRLAVASLGRISTHPLLLPVLFYGLMTGAAMASKVSAAPIALMLPVAGSMYLARLPEAHRLRSGVQLAVMMGLSGMLALVTFRVFQPYAFSGPGFFGLALNQNWLDNLGSLSGLVVPSNGYPPSVQWFHRPPWFSGWNMTVWGLGLPLGLAAWAGIIWMGWRIAKGEWSRHLLVWGWVVGYFLWQSSVHNPTMRYQIPIYPGMALMAAWALVRFSDRVRHGLPVRAVTANWIAGLGRPLAWALALLVLGGTAAYALAFSSIYQRDVTRLAASRWIYENVPGAISLQIAGPNGGSRQHLPFPNGFAFRPGEPYRSSFVPRVQGTLQEVQIPHLSLIETLPEEASLLLSVYQVEESGEAAFLSSAEVRSNFAPSDQAGAQNITFYFERALEVDAGGVYRLDLELRDGGGTFDLCQPVKLLIFEPGGGQEIELPVPQVCTVMAGQPFSTSFSAPVGGSIPGVVLDQPLDYRTPGGQETIEFRIAGQPDGPPLATASLEVQGSADDLTFRLDHPVDLQGGVTYFIELSTSGGLASIAGSVLAQETSWDDPLPMRVDGYDGFGGVYQGDRNMELYWEDNPEKLDRIVNVLDEVDMIPISSSRQWGSLTRLPERWPMVQAYYRALMGCPEERTVEWCYNVAEPGMFEGQLGFELVRTFQSNPTLFGISINDQFSEEAFTVYDHPKVFIFSKTEAYDSASVRALLSAALQTGLPPDLAGAVQGGAAVKSLLLPEERLIQQAEGGTWSELFDSDSLVNRFQPLTVLVWYLAVAVVGLAAYPILRAAFPGLPDRGYPQGRALGLLLVSYTAWMAGSAGIEVSRPVITIVLLLILALGGVFAYRQREGLAREIRERKNYYLLVETLALAFFGLMLVIRLGNPDLWHPWKGGEKPMDFSYFNAVLKSETYPPFDPWFSGGYINYYYFGFIFVGTLVKWLGIVPAVAYNLILPTLFSLVALGAFSLAWNMVQAVQARKSGGPDREQDGAGMEGPGSPGGGTGAPTLPFLAGLAASIGVAILGNLGTLEMIYQGYQRIAAPPEAVLEETFFLTRWLWGFRGLLQTLTTEVNLPYGIADWYWNPSRAIKAPGDIEPITEFPFFTFVYGDLHAHMIALPLALLALTWALGVLLGRGRWHSLADGITAFLIGGLVIGALRPTNTWDYPTYLSLGLAALVYTAVRYFKVPPDSAFAEMPQRAVGALAAMAGAIWLVALSWFLYQPYTRWYALGYTDVQPWSGTHTPIGDYLVHWGTFLFLTVSWMLWETREWLESTPAAAGLRYLRRIRGMILAGGTFLVLWILWLWTLDVSVVWLVLPLAAWAGILLLRPALPDAKRAVLFLFGTGLALTLMVETIVLAGDLGRMNTVFKFYLQVWLLFGIGAAASLGWLLPALQRWRPSWGLVWRFGLAALVFSAFLYPLLAGLAKIEDRMSDRAPITLDGMAYMPTSTYFDQGRELTFDEDYRAIRWMQENVSGTPVIVEAQVVEYRWGSRFSVYTGLPAVLGWNWHQRQQRTGHDMDVWDRATAIDAFYRTPDPEAARRFLEEFGVRYVVLGQLERAYYDGEGLAKFDTLDGSLWHSVYRDGQTVIYEVSPQVVSQ